MADPTDTKQYLYDKVFIGNCCETHLIILDAHLQLLPNGAQDGPENKSVHTTCDCFEVG